MVDWTKSMGVTYEYYLVDPNTWENTRKLDFVKNSNISRDHSSETRGSATIEVTKLVGECYVREYLVTIQNGVTERHPLGTHLVQSPSSGFDGKVKSVTLDAYTPLLELKEKFPPIGYSLLKGDNIMEKAYQIVRENVRAPVVRANCDITLDYDFVANPGDTWVTFVAELIANAKYELGLDELGRVIFLPKQDTAALQPVWTYTAGNASILHPEITMDHDLYGIPNVVEVIYSNGMDSYYAKVINDDPNSPTSIVNRGRVIPHIDTNPSLVGNATEYQVKEYARQLLKEMSTVEYTISYTHGYCPTRVGDCVRLDVPEAGLNGVKARVISQSIGCKTECSVKEKAVYTTTLWG